MVGARHLNLRWAEVNLGFVMDVGPIVRNQAIQWVAQAFKIVKRGWVLNSLHD